MAAAANGNTAVVKLLLARDDTDLNSKDEHDGTPLIAAATLGHTAVVKLLLRMDGIDLDAKTIDGETALSLAAKFGNDAAVKLLTRHTNRQANHLHPLHMEQDSAAESSESSDSAEN
jgi:ankyrin repeat protein